MYPRKLLIVFVALMVLLSYKVLFSSASLSAGDAPYLTAWLMKSYIAEPEAWTTVGTSLGGQNQFLWIAPYMSLISLVGSALGFSSGLMLRVFFYIPGILMSIVGSYFFACRYTKSNTSRLITSLIYSVNTYFLMVVDGGQVGIVLAYGLFPWVIMSLSEVTNKLSYKSLIL